jgi:hypothetical protein
VQDTCVWTASHHCPHLPLMQLLDYCTLSSLPQINQYSCILPPPVMQFPNTRELTLVLSRWWRVMCSKLYLNRCYLWSHLITCVYSLCLVHIFCWLFCRKLFPPSAVTLFMQWYLWIKILFENRELSTWIPSAKRKLYVHSCILTKWVLIKCFSQVLKLFCFCLFRIFDKNLHVTWLIFKHGSPFW